MFTLAKSDFQAVCALVTLLPPGIQYTACPDTANSPAMSFSVTGGSPTLGSVVGTSVQTTYTLIQYNTTVQCYNAVLQYYTTVYSATIQYYSTILQYSPTIQYYSTILQYSPTIQYYSTILQYSDTILYCNTVVQYIVSYKLTLSVLPLSFKYLLLYNTLLDAQ